MNNQLYKKLLDTRDQIKKQANGRTPVVCTDAALLELARLTPKRKEEMLAIHGLGPNFVKEYGDAFMQVLTSYHQSFIKNAQVKPGTLATLIKLQDRLVNINRRNRLLYMAKIYNKYAVDLYNPKKEENKKLAEFLVKNKSQSFKLCQLKPDETFLESERQYKKLVALLREVTKDFRESGQYDLYIGYPFVIGRILGENFNVRAPLALFPIDVVREADLISIKINPTKDVLYNNNLVLLHNKFNNLNKDLPNPAIEEFNADTFLPDLFKFYEENGIKIIQRSENDGEIKNFKDYTPENFPEFKSGELYLEKNIVLGKFSLYSTSLQKDFKEIIDSKEINKLLDELLLGSEEVDYLNDEPLPEEKQVENLVFKEQNIHYINSLNSAQENAIVQIAQKDKLVIQGPPGTGKSQTIASLISDFANKGKVILMVSQKKAALDVIYSRLGDLSKFALFIHDVKDKDAFYKQMEAFIHNANKHVFNDEQKFLTLANDIEADLQKLEKIAEELYTEHDDTPMYKIYQENDGNLHQADTSAFSTLYENIDKACFFFKYRDLKDIYKKCNQPALLKSTTAYLTLVQNHGWLKQVKPNLSRYDLAQALEKINVYITNQNAFLAQGFFKRLFTRGKTKKELSRLLKEFFISKKGVKKPFFKKPENLLGIKSYDEYHALKPIYDALNDKEKYFCASVAKLVGLEATPLPQVAKSIFDFLIIHKIDAFEKENRILFGDIANFKEIAKRICSAMDEKKIVTKQKLQKELQNIYYTYIRQAKRFGEFCRNVESKRRPSVNKFISKFQFELFKGVKIMLMTPEVVSEILPLENGLFDLLIFDEASQLYVEKGIPSIMRTKKVVIAGDHKQLRPSSLGVGRTDYDDEVEDEETEDTRAALEEESLLDLARFKYDQVMLNYHYRSKYEELIAFSNYAFYKGRLQVSPNLTKPDKPPIEVIKINNGVWINRANKPEATRVVELLKEFFKNRKKQETVGIISFNSTQRDLILDLLDEECKKDPHFAIVYKKELERKENGEDIGLFIKNIENVQGDERDCIIFSFAYGKNESGKIIRNFGWLNQQGGENRLNVAISRAKEKIYIVTSITPQELYTDDLKSRGPALLRKYLEYANAISSSNQPEAKRILLSLYDTTQNNTNESNESTEGDFENQVYHALIEKGLSVEKQVGIGGYSIDLAIQNKSQTKYLLGIECDSKLYHSSSTARERDIHRQTYLEARGWTMHRIWSSYWWHNKEQEIEKICKLIAALELDV